jgi:hypothetical protein
MYDESHKPYQAVSRGIMMLRTQRRNQDNIAEWKVPWRKAKTSRGLPFCLYAQTSQNAAHMRGLRHGPRAELA